MSMEMAPPVPAGVKWAHVEPTLWVASAQGEFLGSVERVDESFLASDGLALEVGTFSDLDSAKLGVLLPQQAERAGHSRRQLPDDVTLARATAAVGGLVVVALLFMVGLGILT